MLEYIIPILFVSLLCAGWVVVQLVALKMNTKNHFDNLTADSCGKCGCGGAGDGSCETKAVH